MDHIILEWTKLSSQLHHKPFEDLGGSSYITLFCSMVWYLEYARYNLLKHKLETQESLRRQVKGKVGLQNWESPDDRVRGKEGEGT